MHFFSKLSTMSGHILTGLRAVSGHVLTELDAEGVDVCTRLGPVAAQFFPNVSTKSFKIGAGGRLR